VLKDMELWTEIRRLVLTGELSRRQAVKDYQLNDRTIQKIVGHVEPPRLPPEGAAPAAEA